MQRRTSLQRLRKHTTPHPSPHCDRTHPHSQAVVPSKPDPESSFFEYGKKGWHAPAPPPDPSLKRRPSHRKVSKDQITYPLIHPTDTLDLWIESSTMSAAAAARKRSKSQEPERPRERAERPPRPSLDERPPVVRDPHLREREQQVYRSANNAKRPERPSEEDLPYGPRGGIPKALLDEGLPPAPAAAVRGRARPPIAKSNTVPFPSNQRPPPASASSKIFNPFATSADTGTAQRGRTQEPSSARSAAQVNRAQTYTHTQTRTQADLRRHGTIPDPQRDRERRPKPPPKDAKWLVASASAEDVRLAATATATSAAPTQSRHGRVRRISSTGDVNLPPQHARYQPKPRHERERESQQQQRGRGAEIDSRPAPELRTVKSSPLSARPSPPQSAPAFARGYGLPAHPAVFLERGRSGSRREDRHPDVPRDVSPENRLTMLTHRSADEARPRVVHPASVNTHHLREREQERPNDISTTPANTEASTRAKASASAPRPLVVSKSQNRAESERQREIEREIRLDRRLRRQEERAARDLRSYGAMDDFARQICLALAEPESATPVQWDVYIAGAKDHGTRPLVTRKNKERERERDEMSRTKF